MLISLWQIIITAFGNAVEDLSLFPGFPFHRCRQQKKKNPFRTYVNILSKYCSPAFKPLSTFQTVGCCSRKCTWELLVFVFFHLQWNKTEWPGYYFAMRLARGKFLSCFYFCAGAQWLLQGLTLGYMFMRFIILSETTSSAGKEGSPPRKRHPA